jgi:hypothetical protein
MGPVDLIYRPHTHQINFEIQMQEQRTVAMPSPDDQWRRQRGQAGQPGTERS